MRIDVSQEPGVTIVALSGKVMGGVDATMFSGSIQENIGHGRSFVVDLEQVDWVNSIGLGMLISAYKAVGNRGGRLVLSNITNIESLLSMTRLLTKLEAYDSNPEALESLKR